MSGRGMTKIYETEREVRSRRKREQDEWAKEGGYMQAKIQKLINKYKTDSGHAENEDEPKSRIFESVAIFINGYTEPSFDVLRQYMIEHGGTFEHYYSSTRVTHIIATSLALSKQKLFQKKKVVLPSWITDSVERNELQPYDKYLLLPQNRITNFFSPTRTRDEAEEETNLQLELDIFDDISDPQPSTSGLANTTPSKQTSSTPKPSLGISKPTTSKISPPSTSKVNPPSMLPADNPGFVSEFYNNSRLHHISHWRTHLKDMVNEIRADPNHKLTGRDALVQKYSHKIVPGSCSADQLSGDIPSQEGTTSISSSINDKVYMHIDMDCFFVSVALRKYPEMADKPIAVAHSKTESASTNSMSEIASCNYLARQAGVKNGMFMGRALTLCPQLENVPYDFDGYSEVSTLLYQIVSSFTTEIEAVSCDELYVDISNLLSITDNNTIASELRKEIKERTGCPCSTGMGGNLLLARLATRRAKPDGQYYIRAEDVEEFMSDHSVRDLPGVGRATNKRLEQIDVKTCADLQKLTAKRLREEFGIKTGDSLYNLCRGVDDRCLRPDQPRQSVSCDVNYGIRLTNQSQVEELFKNVSSEVSKKLENAKLLAKQVTLKIKVRSADAPVQSAKFMGHGICDSLSKSSNLRRASRDATLIQTVCFNMWRGMSIKPADLRGVGIQMTKLESVQATKSDKQAAISNFLVSKSSNKATSSHSIAGAHMSAVKVGHGLVVIDSDEEGTGLLSSSSRKDNSCANLVPNIVPAVPSLCGRNSVAEISDLLERWIRTCSDKPTNKDKLRFTGFMSTLVSSHHLDLMQDILSNFTRRIKKSASAEWLVYLVEIKDHLHTDIGRKYRASMKL